ncbi:hypothetical protein DPMN_087922 [Dreissena polymorpha]|uniref:Uncharacterized protein n=1 Tax=Dreissena polymorpha TaxID=45954 RepID=A0A9D4QXE3_DREPO|nr:hypothetical protein DPMN_087922 [Dreissena polymorpha]
MPQSTAVVERGFSAMNDICTDLMSQSQQTLDSLMRINLYQERPYPGNAQYTYNNWSPQAQSNETSNGYFLERSQSARVTLAKAIELCPEEDPEDAELTDDQDTSHTREESVSPGGTGEETDNAQTQKTTDKKTVQNNQLPWGSNWGPSVPEADALPLQTVAHLSRAVNVPDSTHSGFDSRIRKYNGGVSFDKAFFHCLVLYSPRDVDCEKSQRLTPLTIGFEPRPSDLESDALPHDHCPPHLAIEQAPPENSETGEEEHKKDENKIIEGLKDKESDIPTEKEIFVTKQTSKDVKAASTKDKGKPV